MTSSEAPPQSATASGTNLLPQVPGDTTAQHPRPSLRVGSDPPSEQLPVTDDIGWGVLSEFLKELRAFKTDAHQTVDAIRGEMESLRAENRDLKRRLDTTLKVVKIDLARLQNTGNHFVKRFDSVEKNVGQLKQASGKAASFQSKSNGGRLNHLEEQHESLRRMIHALEKAEASRRAKEQKSVPGNRTLKMENRLGRLELSAKHTNTRLSRMEQKTGKRYRDDPPSSGHER